MAASTTASPVKGDHPVLYTPEKVSGEFIEATGAGKSGERTKILRRLTDSGAGSAATAWMVTLHSAEFMNLSDDACGRDRDWHVMYAAMQGDSDFRKHARRLADLNADCAPYPPASVVPRIHVDSGITKGLAQEFFLRLTKAYTPGMPIELIDGDWLFVPCPLYTTMAEFVRAQVSGLPLEHHPQLVAWVGAEKDKPVPCETDKDVLEVIRAYIKVLTYDDTASLGDIDEAENPCSVLWQWGAVLFQSIHSVVHKEDLESLKRSREDSWELSDDDEEQSKRHKPLPVDE